MPDAVSAVLCSWWWTENRLKHVQRLTEVNKLRNVASCWLYSTNIGCVSNSHITWVTSTVPSRAGETWGWREVSNPRLQSLNCLYHWGRTTPDTHCCRRNFCFSLSFHFLTLGMKEDISNYGRWRGWEMELRGLAWKLEVLVPSPGFSG